LSDDLGELTGSRLWTKDFSSSDSHFTVDGTNFVVSKCFSDPRLDSVLTIWQQEVHSDTKYDGNNAFRQDQPSTISILVASMARVCVTSPLPTRETSSCYSIESECQNAADDSTEVTEYCHQDYTLSQLVGSVPVAELQQDAWPQTGFL
jgi:hypothetical protein